MRNRDTFSTYNPVINFTFFIGAVVFGIPDMFLRSFIGILSDGERHRRT